MIVNSGERIERVPAWIQRVTQDLAVSPVYEARFWNPPSEKLYKFKHPRPSPPSSLRIYEAHVGISTSEHRVGTYKEFTQNVLPRIRDLGYNSIQLMAVMEHAYYACKRVGVADVFHTLIICRNSVRIPCHELFCCELPLRYPRGTEGADRHRAQHGYHRSSRHGPFACLQERA